MTNSPEDGSSAIALPSVCLNLVNIEIDALNDPGGLMQMEVIRPKLFREFGRVVSQFSEGVADKTISPETYENDITGWVKFTAEFRQALVNGNVLNAKDLAWFDKFILIPHFQRPEGKLTPLHLVIPDATPVTTPVAPAAGTSSGGPDPQHTLELGFRVLGGCFR